MPDQDLELLYQQYSGNRKSDKLQVFKMGSKFRFVYGKYTRTNPSQAERKQGFKPTRILTHEETFDFEHLQNVDFKAYPFHHLLTDFDPKAL